MLTNTGRICLLLVLIICVVFTNVSNAIELNPTKEQIENAINIGEKNPGNEIFDTEFLKPAIFGNWPGFGSGLIKSKLYEVAVMSATMRKAKRRFSEKDAFKLVESKEYLTVNYNGGNDVYKIKLRQGLSLINPSKMIKAEGVDKESGIPTEVIVATFPYSKLDPNAMTTIRVIKDFGVDKYEVDFSRIK